MGKKGALTAAKKKAKLKQKSREKSKSSKDDELHGTSEEVDDGTQRIVGPGGKPPPPATIQRFGGGGGVQPGTRAPGHGSEDEYENESGDEELMNLHTLKHEMPNLLTELNELLGVEMPVTHPEYAEDRSKPDDGNSFLRDKLVDVDALYAKYVGSDFEPDKEPDPADKFDAAAASKLSWLQEELEKNPLSKRSSTSSMCRMLYEDGFRVLKCYLEPGELREILARFYYDMVAKTPAQTSYDLTELYKESVVDRYSDTLVKKLMDSYGDDPKKIGNWEAAAEGEAKSSKDDSSDVLLRGWASIITPELKVRQAMREMVLWYKIKLASSRIDGLQAALDEIATADEVD